MGPGPPDDATEVAGAAEPAVGAAAAGAAGGMTFSGMPVRRYSTARSGLLNAARSALTHASRSNPIDIMLLMVSCSAAPVTSELSGVPAGAAAAEGVAAGVSGVAAAGASGAASGAGAGAAAAGLGAGGGGAGLGALGFWCIITMKLASVTPAAASVASSVSTLPLWMSTISGAGIFCVSESLARTSPMDASSAKSSSNFWLVLLGGFDGTGIRRSARALGGSGRGTSRSRADAQISRPRLPRFLPRG